MTSSIQHSIDVDVPVRVAYNQWTQFEDFPQFMDSVIEVDQLTADTTRWVTEVNGVTREFIEARGAATGAWRGEIEADL